MVDHRTGNPLQVWKWPALLCIGVWNYFGASGPAPAGYAAGAMVGTAIAFLIGTVVARKLGIAQGLPWWVLAVVTTLAGLGSIVGLAVGNVLSGFLIIYLPLVVLAWLAYRGAGAIGLRERVANQQT